MSKIAYVKKHGSSVVHVSVATGEWLGADLHDVTQCGQIIRLYGGWAEAPRPTATGFESDLRRCKRCEGKRIEGTPAFDYDDRPAHVPASVPDVEVDQYLDWYPTKEA